MKAKVIEDKRNPVLKRREMIVEVSHDEKGTPERLTLREFMSKQFDEKIENLYVVKIEGRTGSDKSLCHIEIYESRELAEDALPEHVITRNLPPEKRKAKQKKEEEKREEAKKEKAKEKSKGVETGKPQPTEAKKEKTEDKAKAETEKPKK